MVIKNQISFKIQANIEERYKKWKEQAGYSSNSDALNFIIQNFLDGNDLERMVDLKMQKFLESEDIKQAIREAVDQYIFERAMTPTKKAQTDQI